MWTNINKLYELDMHHSNNNNFNILDLANEILFIIFNKLKMTDVLYSLVNVNQRFDRLALDPLYIRDLDLTDIMAINSIYDHLYSIDPTVLSRICQQVLPRIHHEVHRLTLEEYSMKDILLPGYYPQLYSLSLLNFTEETLQQHLTGLNDSKEIKTNHHFFIEDNLIFRDLLTKQITHLNIDIKKSTDSISAILADCFGSILTLCQNLIVLNYGDVFPTRECSTVVILQSRHYGSSTLTNLKINVQCFLDCLTLLDGHLECLSTLTVTVATICDPILNLGQDVSVNSMKKKHLF